MTDGRDDAEEWPADLPRYRLRLPAADEFGALEGLACALDAAERPPATLAFHVAAGRRDDRERVRTALGDLAAHADVTVDDHDAEGTVPMTGDTFDALASLSDEIRSLCVQDAADAAIVSLCDETLTVALPSGACEGLREMLSPRLADRLERID